MKPLIDPINTSDGLFHGKNKETGELATIVTADYMNDDQAATRSMQQEVIAILTAAGIKPAEATNDQLLTALKDLFLAEDDSRVSGALQKAKNLSDVADASTTLANIGGVPTTRKINSKALSADITLSAGDVGAVQQGGGTGMETNKVSLGWDGSKLIVQVDSTPMGELFYNNNPPTKSTVGLGNVGNFMSVQQGGGVNQGANKVYIGWGTDSKLRLSVDTTDLGAMYYESNPPPIAASAVTGFRYASSTWVATGSSDWSAPSGTCVTGVGIYTGAKARYSYAQILVNGQWLNVETVS